MAPIRKRKRHSAQAYSDRPNKKSKPLSSEEESLPPTQTQSDPQKEYKARDILAETKTQYKIDWEDDPVTGEKYAPTWEPKRNANELLVRAWIAKKEAQKKPKQKGAKGASPAQKAINIPPSKARNERARRRPVIQSSQVDEVEPAQESARETSSPLSSPAGTDLRARNSSPLFEPLQTDDQHPRELSPRPKQDHVVSVTQPSDFDPAEYDRFSRLPTSSSAQPVETQPSETQAFETPGPKESSGSLSFGVPTTVNRGGVVPDSQSLPGSSSYIPSTQAQSGSKSDPRGVVRAAPSSSSTEGPRLESTIEEISAFGPESSSAPVPESDPIEEATSPVAAEEDQSDRFLPDSPDKTATSASSPPPTEDLEKTQSESQSQAQPASADGQRNEEPRPDPSGAVAVEEHQVEDRQVEGHQVGDYQAEDYQAEDRQVEDHRDIQSLQEVTEAPQEKASPPPIEYSNKEPRSDQSVAPVVEDHQVEAPRVEDHQLKDRPDVESLHEAPEEPQEKTSPPSIETSDHTQSELQSQAQFENSTNQQDQESFHKQNKDLSPKEPSGAQLPDEVTQQPEAEASPQPTEDPDKTQSEVELQSQVPNTVNEEDQEASVAQVKEPIPEEHGDILLREEATQVFEKNPAEAYVNHEAQELGDRAEPEVQVESTNPSLQDVQLVHQTDLSLNTVAPALQAAVQRYTEASLQENPISSQISEVESPPEHVGDSSRAHTPIGDREEAVKSPPREDAQEEPQNLIPSQTSNFEPLQEHISDSRARTPTRDQEEAVKNPPQEQRQEERREPHSPEAALPRQDQTIPEQTITAVAPQEEIRESREEQALDKAVPRLSTIKDPRLSLERLLGSPVSPVLPSDPVQTQQREATQEPVAAVAKTAQLNGTRTSPLDLNLSSSPLPQVPSQLPETFQTNPPYSLQAPSHMSDIPRSTVELMSPRSTASVPATPSLSLTEKLAAMRERHAAKREAARLARSSGVSRGSPVASPARFRSPMRDIGTRSPSIIPNQMPQPSALPEDPTLARRLPTMLPDQSDIPQQEVVVHISEPVEERRDAPASPTDKPSLGPMEFVVPLPLMPTTGDQYRSTVTYNRKTIEEFLAHDWAADSSILNQAVEFVNTMYDVVTHPDLTNAGTLTQQDVSPETQAQWDRNCSSKFKFLYHLLDRLRAHDMYGVIVVRPGRLLDMLETFLDGNHINYARPDQSRKADPLRFRGPLGVTLLPTSGEGSGAIIRSASFIISVDHTLDVSKRNIQALRKHVLVDGQLAPVLHMVVIDSVEHIGRNLPMSLQRPERLRALVSGIAENRQLAGRLPEGYAKPEAAANEVARFLAAHGTEEQWPLPPLPDMDLFQSSESQDSGTSSESASTQEVLTAQKRPLDVESDNDPSKKMRLTPQPETMNPNDTSITHISDSITEHSSQAQKNAQQDHITTLQEQLNALKLRLKETESRYLQSETRNAELAAALNSLQTRYEAQVAETRILNKSLHQANAAAAQSLNRQAQQAARITALEAELASSKQGLQAARTALLTSAVPEVAELEGMRVEKEAADSARAKLAEKLAAQDRDFEFLRTQYQTASSSAADLAAQNAALIAENAVLSRKASGEAARARQETGSVAQAMGQERIRRVEMVLRERERLLERKEEEIRVLKMGRMNYGTRAGSVPAGTRSPRVGAVGAAGGGSRASSPMHGGRVGVLRGDGVGRRDE